MRIWFDHPRGDNGLQLSPCALIIVRERLMCKGEFAVKMLRETAPDKTLQPLRLQGLVNGVVVKWIELSGVFIGTVSEPCRLSSCFEIQGIKICASIDLCYQFK